MVFFRAPALFLQAFFIPAFPDLQTPKPLENITFTGLDVARRDLVRDLALDLKNVIIYLLKIKYIISMKFFL